jgi:hypothetical protein
MLSISVAKVGIPDAKKNADHECGKAEARTQPRPRLRGLSSELSVKRSTQGQLWFFWSSQGEKGNGCPGLARSTWDTCKYPTEAGSKFFDSEPSGFVEVE